MSSESNTDISFCARPRDICQTCNKIVNPLKGIKVVKIDKYRKDVDLNSNYNKARVVLDIDMKKDRVLYYMLFKALKGQDNEHI